MKLLKEMFTIMIILAATGFAYSDKCDPLFGCPIDPGKCVRNPSSCGVG
ncbi:MAG TPA: hypothetical protein VIG33_17400 [Pseudobdellovibrionaceae bacterium]|jgi:hypothetical protein